MQRSVGARSGWQPAADATRSAAAVPSNRCVAFRANGQQRRRAAVQGQPASRQRRVVVSARASRYDRRRPPPPDLPSLLLDNRIVYLGMPLVPAVTELIIAELLYLEKQGPQAAVEMLINSSGTTRQDGEILAFDSEGIAITATMGFVKNPISTVNMGLAVGWSCAILAFGKKGMRKSLPHSLAMIQQPRVPPTGQRQAIEVHIKWREVLDYKREYLRTLSIGTGFDVEKLDADMQRPLYMRPQDMLDYGVIDEIIQPDAAKQEAATEYWLKSGRAESEGRLEQWKEYIELQEKYSLQDSFKKVRAQQLRSSYRKAAQTVLPHSQVNAAELEIFKEQVPKEMLVDGGEAVRLPMSPAGLRMALLNAEQYADRNVQRQFKAGKVTMPESWEEEIKKAPAAKEDGYVDYAALVRTVEDMAPEEFAKIDLDKLVAQYSRR